MVPLCLLNIWLLQIWSKIMMRKTKHITIRPKNNKVQILVKNNDETNKKNYILDKDELPIWWNGHDQENKTNYRLDKNEKNTKRKSKFTTT